MQKTGSVAELAWRVDVYRLDSRFTNTLPRLETNDTVSKAQRSAVIEFSHQESEKSAVTRSNAGPKAREEFQRKRCLQLSRAGGATSEPQYSAISNTMRPTEDCCEHSLANDWTADRTVRTVSVSSTCTVMIVDSNAASSSHLLRSNEWQNSSLSVPSVV